MSSQNISTYVLGKTYKSEVHLFKLPLTEKNFFRFIAVESLSLLSIYQTCTAEQSFAIDGRGGPDKYFWENLDRIGNAL